MPINTDEIIKLVAELSTLEELKVTVTESAKGACIVGASAFVGSLMGGPPGLALGKSLTCVFEYLPIILYNRLFIRWNVWISPSNVQRPGQISSSS